MATVDEISEMYRVLDCVIRHGFIQTAGCVLRDIIHSDELDYEIKGAVIRYTASLKNHPEMTEWHDIFSEYKKQLKEERPYEMSAILIRLE